MKKFVPSVSAEFASVKLGDVRLRRRVSLVVERLCKAPGLGFPRALKTESETEGFYRLVTNRRVSYDVLVESHARQTLGRMPAGGTVRVIHDTTEVAFGGEPASREGLGRLRTKDAQGFFAHIAFAVDGTETAQPLGTIGALCWARTAPKRRNRKLAGAELAKLVGKESSRWSDLVERVEDLIDGKSSAIHLMDREGDSFPLLCDLQRRGARFVIRMARDRTVELQDERMPLSEAVIALPEYLQREVPISRRAAKQMPRSTHDKRKARVAKLSVSAGKIALQRPRYYEDDLPEELHVNLVYVQEVDAPEGEEPVAWVLVTSEAIETPEQVAAVVDHYRARWMIEEFFKALKSGCSLEKRQLESFQALTNALALFLPIAWQMLLLRAMSRSDPNAPASQVLTPTQLAVLRHYQPQKMPAQGATAKDALYAVAGLGGHLKNNGAPGWSTLAYGMQELTSLVSAWQAALAFSAKNGRTL
jgi:Transposase DNA-binding/Transposase DDE domain